MMTADSEALVLGPPLVTNCLFPHTEEFRSGGAEQRTAGRITILNCTRIAHRIYVLIILAIDKQFFQNNLNAQYAAVFFYNPG